MPAVQVILCHSPGKKSKPCWEDGPAWARGWGGGSTGGRSDELQLELHSGSGKNAQRQHLREWVSLRINLWFSWVFFAHQFSLRLGAMDSLWAAQDRSI